MDAAGAAMTQRAARNDRRAGEDELAWLATSAVNRATDMVADTGHELVFVDQPRSVAWK
jgi:hypothetical protein